MSHFYLPLTFQTNSIPVILYPYQGIEKIFSRQEKGSLENYVSSVLTDTAAYAISILWQDGNDIMTDVWLFGEFESWEAGPVVSVKNYRNGFIDTQSGVTAGDGLIMLGKEEEQRRKSNSIEEYLNGPRPELPFNLTPTEDFYL